MKIKKKNTGITNLSIVKSGIYVIQIYIFILLKTDWNVAPLKPFIISYLLDGYTLQMHMHTHKQLGRRETDLWETIRIKKQRWDLTH